MARKLKTEFQPLSNKRLITYDEGIKNLEGRLVREGAINDGIYLVPNNNLTFEIVGGVINDYDDTTIDEAKDYPVAGVNPMIFDIIDSTGTILENDTTELRVGGDIAFGKLDDGLGNITDIPANNDATFIQFYINKDGDVKALLGQRFYASINIARQTYFTERKTLPSILNGYIFIGGFLGRKDATNLQAVNVYPVFASKSGEINIGGGESLSVELLKAPLTNLATIQSLTNPLEGEVRQDLSDLPNATFYVHNLGEWTKLGDENNTAPLWLPNTDYVDKALFTQNSTLNGELYLYTRDGATITSGAVWDANEEARYVRLSKATDETTVYIDGNVGDNSNDGKTSDNPWLNFANIKQGVNYKIYILSETTFEDVRFENQNVSLIAGIPGGVAVCPTIGSITITNGNLEVNKENANDPTRKIKARFILIQNNSTLFSGNFMELYPQNDDAIKVRRNSKAYFQYGVECYGVAKTGLQSVGNSLIAFRNGQTFEFVGTSIETIFRVQDLSTIYINDTEPTSVVTPTTRDAFISKDGLLQRSPVTYDVSTIYSNILLTTGGQIKGWNDSNTTETFSGVRRAILDEAGTFLSQSLIPSDNAWRTYLTVSPLVDGDWFTLYTDTGKVAGRILPNLAGTLQNWGVGLRIEVRTFGGALQMRSVDGVGANVQRIIIEREVSIKSVIRPEDSEIQIITGVTTTAASFETLSIPTTSGSKNLVSVDVKMEFVGGSNNYFATYQDDTNGWTYRFNPVSGVVTISNRTGTQATTGKGWRAVCIYQ